MAGYEMRWGLVMDVGHFPWCFGSAPAKSMMQFEMPLVEKGKAKVRQAQELSVLATRQLGAGGQHNHPLSQNSPPTRLWISNCST